MFIMLFLCITCFELQLKKQDFFADAETQNTEFMKLIRKRKTRNEIRSIFKAVSTENPNLFFINEKSQNKTSKLDLQNYQGMDLVKINNIIIPKITLFLLLKKIKRSFNKNKLICKKIKEVLDKKKRKSLRIYILEKEMMSKNIEAGINSFKILFENLLNMKCPANELNYFFITTINILYHGLKNLKQGSIKRGYYILIKNDVRMICLKEVKRVFFEMYLDLLIK